MPKKQSLIRLYKLRVCLLVLSKAVAIASLKNWPNDKNHWLFNHRLAWMCKRCWVQKKNRFQYYQNIVHLFSIKMKDCPEQWKKYSNYHPCLLCRYIKEQKKEMERERVIKAKEAADDCPEGHILLPDEIRQKHLAALKDSKLLCIY